MNDNHHSRVSAVMQAPLNHKLRDVLNGMPDFFFVLDNEFNILTANRAFEQHVGAEEVNGLDQLPYNAAVPGWFHDSALTKLFHEALATQEACHTELQHRHMGNWYEVRLNPSPEGLTVMLRDISKQKRREKRMKQTDTHLQAMLNSTDEVILLADAHHRILLFNEEARRFALMLTKQRLAIGGNAQDFVTQHICPEFEEPFAQALKGEASSIEVEVEAPGSGVTRWYELIYFPVTDYKEEIMGVAIKLRDINAPKRFALKLQQQNDTLKAIAHEQSHMVRGPVARILGLLDLIDLAPEEKAGMLEKIRAQTIQLDEIIHQIVEKTQNS